jgi:hypothetical protein
MASNIYFNTYGCLDSPHIISISINIENSITGTRFSSAINLENGATNQFILIADEGQFTLYANDTRLGTFYDYSNQMTEGQFAFYGYQDSGESTCTFENTWIWVLE